MAVPSEPPTRKPPQIPFAVYVTCYVVLALLLVYALVVRWLHPAVLEEPIRVEPARVAQVEQRIDPNTAGWAELARLPGVGESLAKRIVAYRDAKRDTAGRPGEPPPIVFRAAEDLDAVPGIGPSTVDKLRPHLRFPRAPETRSHPPPSR